MNKLLIYSKSIYVPVTELGQGHGDEWDMVQGINKLQVSYVSTTVSSG